MKSTKFQNLVLKKEPDIREARPRRDMSLERDSKNVKLDIKSLTLLFVKKLLYISWLFFIPEFLHFSLVLLVNITS